MANEQKPNPANEEESDVSKAQSARQPTGQNQSDDQPDKGQQGETATRQRSDVEGAALSGQADKAEDGFVGSQSDADSSSELVEDQDLAKDEDEDEGPIEGQ
jgi:hypothetical protein